MQAEKMAELMRQIQAWGQDMTPQANQATINQTGSLTPTVGNAQVQSGAMGALQAQNPLYGIPKQAIQADLAFNEGKDISKMMLPQTEFINGVAVDKKRVQPGTSIPQVSPTGEGYQIIADPSSPNGYRIVAPTGSQELMRQNLQLKKDIETGNTPIQAVSPEGKPTYRTQKQIVEQAQGGAGPGVFGAIQADMRKNDIGSANFDIQGMQGSILNDQVRPSQTPDQIAAAAATKDYATKRATEQATDMGAIQQKGLAAPSKIATLKYIGDLYDGFEGGTLSNFAMKVASTANSLGIKIDPKLPDKEAAGALARELALTLRATGQGSGMPGALSDADREFLVSMSPNLAQTAAGRKKVIDSHVALAQREADVAQFARNYENKYGRLDNGFFTQLSEYSKKNPVFK